MRAEAPDLDDRPALWLAIPLYDEEASVRTVVEDLVIAFAAADIPLTLALVDNGSRDGTGAAIDALAQEHDGVRAIHLERNAGYGGGILAGLRGTDTPVVGYMWGDGQVSAADAVRVHRRLVLDGADVAKTRRIRRHDGWRRAAISAVYNTATLWLFHLTSTDANGCPKLFTREAWECLGPRSRDWFLDAEVMIGAAERGLRLAEVDVVFHARWAGESKVGWGTVAQFARRLLLRRLRA